MKISMMRKTACTTFSKLQIAFAIFCKNFLVFLAIISSSVLMLPCWNLVTLQVTRLLSNVALFSSKNCIVERRLVKTWYHETFGVINALKANLMESCTDTDMSRKNGFLKSVSTWRTIQTVATQNICALWFC